MAISFIDTAYAPFVSTFLLVFGVVFGMLVYSKIGDFSRKINAVIALAFAFFAVVYEPLVLGLQQYMPIAIILFVVLFFVVFLKKIFEGKEGQTMNDTLPIAASLGILLLVFMVQGEGIASFLPGGVDVNTMLWIIGIIFAVLIFYAAYSYKGK